MPEGFRVASAFVQVSPDMEGFKEELKARLDEAVAGTEARARVTLDTSELDAKADQARARVDELDGARAEPSVHLDDADLGARADQARAKIDELDSKSARPDIGLESSELDEQVDRAREKLDQLDGKRTAPVVSLDTAEFDAKLDEARAKLDAFSSKSASARLGASGGSGGSSGGGGEGGGLGGALALGLGAMLPGLGGAAAAVGLGGAAGFLGLGGIGKALSAAHQASLNVGLTPQELASTQFSNSVQNKQAQDQVTQARMQASQDAITSANSIEQSQMNLASVQRNAAEQQVQALQAVKQAQQGVEEADYSLSEAQYNLNQAWEAAREQVRQLDDQLADSKLNVQSAELAIQQAMYQQRLTNQNAYSTSLDRQQAALAVARAQQQLTDAQDQQTASAYAANLAHQQGVSGSQTVIQAQQAVTAAQYGQADSHASLTEAQSQATLTQLNNADQIKQAQMQLAATEEQTAFQREMDARNVALAERNVTDTLREQQLQMAATMSTSNEAANEFAKDMARLSPAAQQVVEQILSMKGSFKELETAAQNAIAPGLLVFLQGVSAMMPEVTVAVTKMATLISGAFADLGRAMQTKGAQEVFAGLVTNGLQFAQVVVPAFAGFAGELLKIGSAPGASSGIANVLAGIGHALTGLTASIGTYTPQINNFLSAVGVIIAQIGPPLGVIIGQVAKALGPLATYLNQHPNGTVVKVIGDIVAGMLALQGLKKIIPDVLLGPLEKLGDKALLGPLKSTLKSIPGLFKDSLGPGGGWDYLVQSVKGFAAPGGPWDGIRLQAMYAGENVSKAVSGWGSNIANAVKGVMPTKLDAQLLLQSAKDAGSQLASRFMSAASSVGTWFTTTLPAATRSGMSSLGTFASSAGETIAGWGSSVGTAMSSAASSTAAFVADFGSKLAAAAVATGTWIAEQTVAAATFIAENVAEAAAATTAFIAENLATMGIVAGIALVVTAVIYLATHWKQVFADIESWTLWLWHNVLDPFWQAIEWGAMWLYDHGIQPLVTGFTEAFDKIESGAGWLKDHVFAPFFSDIQKGAESFVSTFGTAWGKLEDVFKSPVNFLISTVYTDGIEALWNGVVGAIGQDSLKLPDIKPFATGGVVPGYAPGEDTVPAMLSPGEGVLVPEAVRALGPQTVLALNAAYGGGRVSTPGHYKGGGIISNLWGDVTGGISKAVDLGKIVAAVTTGNTTALDNALTKLVGTNAVGNLGKLMLGMPTTLIHDAVQAVASLFGGGSSGKGSSSASSPGPISGTVADWFAAAVQATGVPTSWIPDLETIGMHESSNNPNAANNWDSNAAAGDPSRGIMQTIMSTFLAYHQAGTANNIFDPTANIASAINYIKARYHDVTNVPGIKSLARGGPYVGYDSGGWLMPSGMPVNGLGRPEAVLTPDESQAFVAIVRQLTQQGGAGTALGSKGVVINFTGTQYPNPEQLAAIKRDMALALG
ncbi:hypothetical protein OG455_41175 [Kitasatospora sp. NBC_01287]|uniref:hypothetical protein n=1 Tax=Kitasatospora sp. NBC_01287 TaxID=2903573 RepID=UPI002250E065|nr:hypothetical protein [Kitasatospora sp. NBC_01287]MCX4750895.1 hypothetical protein [Kitasatospora sp. NBC_01287]MCX4751854.1 hypothetical protein [Kitasatospora sp. NBC_01287]